MARGGEAVAEGIQQIHPFMRQKRQMTAIFTQVTTSSLAFIHLSIAIAIELLQLGSMFGDLSSLTERSGWSRRSRASMLRSLRSFIRPRPPSPPPPDEFTLLHRAEWVNKHSIPDGPITLDDVATAFYTQFYRERCKSQSNTSGGTNVPSEQDIRYWPETEVKNIRGYYHQKYGRSFIRSTIVRPIQQSEQGGVITVHVRSDLPMFKILDGTACHGDKKTKFVAIECPEWYDGQIIVDDLKDDDLADVVPTLPASSLSGAEGLQRQNKFRDLHRLCNSIFSQMLRQPSGLGTNRGFDSTTPFHNTLEVEGNAREESYEMDHLLPHSA